MGEGVAEGQEGDSGHSLPGRSSHLVSVHADRTMGSVTEDLLTEVRESNSRESAHLVGTPEHTRPDLPRRCGPLRVHGVPAHLLWTTAPSKSHSNHPATTSVNKI